MRGMVTDEIRVKAKELLDIENISTEELRLMPYVQYLLVNNENIAIQRINQAERKVLSEWRSRGWIEGGASNLCISKNFWDAICELIYLGYIKQWQK